MICALTTIDNPFDPIDDFNNWYNFDLDKGYCTSEYLDRVAHYSNQMSDEENEKEKERAIDEIIKYDFLNIFKKIKREE